MRRPRRRRGAGRPLRAPPARRRAGRRGSRQQRRRRLGAGPRAAPARRPGLGDGAAGPGGRAARARWRALRAGRRRARGGARRALAQRRARGGRAARHRRAGRAPRADGRAARADARPRGAGRRDRRPDRRGSANRASSTARPRATLIDHLRRRSAAGHLLARDEVGDARRGRHRPPAGRSRLAGRSSPTLRPPSGCAGSGAATTRASAAGSSIVGGDAGHDRRGRAWRRGPRSRPARGWCTSWRRRTRWPRWCRPSPTSRPSRIRSTSRPTAALLELVARADARGDRPRARAARPGAGRW